MFEEEHVVWENSAQILLGDEQGIGYKIFIYSFYEFCMVMRENG